MGPSRPDLPDIDLPPLSSAEDGAWTENRASSPLPPPGYAQQREPMLRYVVLFAVTLATTTLAGVNHYASFALGFSSRTLDMSLMALLVRGLWYSVSILAILGAHEYGHYAACRYYRVNSSAPYFIPLYIPFIGPSLTGTLGAVIRIRQPIPGKRALFDIGIAGPIAGFVVAVPVLLVGMYLSTVVEVPRNFDGSIVELGEPLLFKAATWLTFGHVPDGYTVNMHPMAFAAWFGMLATALNLFPIGQLDGGHISYAVLGRKSTVVTLAMVVCLIGLTFVSMSWLVWTVLTVGMLLVFGPRHPRVFDEEIPLDRTRMWLALFALIMFVLCFTPAPIQPMDLVRGN
jgi:membrane-associated protease RseP (regulator of RpoE activity)